MSDQPHIQFGRIPGIRRAVRSLRQLHALESENLARLDHLGDDVAALLGSATAGASAAATTQSRLAGLVDSVTALRAQLGASIERLARIEQTVDELTDASAGIRRMETRLAELERVAGRIEEQTAQAVDPSEVGELDLALCAYLAPFLHEPRAIDAGAHRGLLTGALAHQGLQVMAIEPNPKLAARLAEAFEDNPLVTVREAAVSDHSGRATLYLAHEGAENHQLDTSLFGTLRDPQDVDGLGFSAGPDVDTQTLDQFRGDVGWPESIGLIKLDVEGSELAAIEGLGATSAEVVVAEYWERDHMLSGGDVAYGVEPLIKACQRRGLRRWVTLTHEGERVTFMVNNLRAPATSWGNVFFFRELETFRATLEWCQAHLLRNPAEIEALLDLAVAR